MMSEKTPSWGMPLATVQAESNFDRKSRARLSAASGEQCDASEILGIRSMFRRPQYLDISAWIEHVPFAFWIMEALRPECLVELGTHYGVSYFAFCQAAEQNSLGTRCYAVDTWTGDEHSGFYDDSVYNRVNAHNSQRYSSFSQLIRAPFDETLSYFSDRSIDLLHIDGLHTIEAVRHDFESWLPKLSAKGIILFHDTNVRERNFGVHALFQELRQRYPVFEFAHGHGLGVVAVGTEIPDVMKQLFAIEHDPEAKSAVCEAFSRLGEACALARDAKSSADVIGGLESQSNEQAAQLAKMRDEIADLGFQVSSLLNDKKDWLEAKKNLTESAAFRRNEYEKMSKQNARQTRELAALAKRLVQSENLIATLQSSTSWRLTRPLRAAMRLIRKN